MFFAQVSLKVATSRQVLSITSHLRQRGVVCQGPSDARQVALTFDDGPHPMWTPMVLECLATLGCKATFFVVGRAAARFPNLVREALARGHEIGTHLYWHQRPNLNSTQRTCAEIERSRSELEDILGTPVRWLRFPYGDMGGLRAADIQRSTGLRTVSWTFSALDTRARDPLAVVSRVGSGARAGAILLMHDCLADEGCGLAPVYHPDRKVLLAALPCVHELLASRGLSSVTLSELMSREIKPTTLPRNPARGM